MASKAVTVTLGDMAQSAEAHIAAGKFETMSEVVREGLRALDREEARFDEICREKIDEADADTRPDVSAEEVLPAVRAAARERRG